MDLPSWCCERQYICIRLSMKSTSLVMVKNKLLIKMWKSLNVCLPLRKYPQRDTFVPYLHLKGANSYLGEIVHPIKLLPLTPKTFKIPVLFENYLYTIIIFSILKFAFIFVFSSFISILVLEYFLFLLFFNTLFNTVLQNLQKCQPDLMAIRTRWLIRTNLYDLTNLDLVQNRTYFTSCTIWICANDLHLTPPQQLPITGV